MKFEFKPKWQIRSVDEWIARFEPDKDTVSKSVSGGDKKSKVYEGRSAKTLAQFCNKDYAEKIIIETLSPIVGKIDSITAYPEHHTKIDNYGKGRMHDLAIECSCPTGKVFVGIEAKVNESFGPDLKSKYNNSKGNSNIKSRIDDLLGSYYSGMISLDTNPTISYQLLYSAVGVLKEEAVGGHILFIMVFKTDKTDKKKAENNKKKLCEFLEVINAREYREYRNESTEYYEATLNGQKLNIIYKEIDMTK